MHLNHCFRISQSYLSQYPELVTIDCRYGHAAMADPFLRQAGLILIILEQDYDVLQSFFMTPLAHLHNCLYLIGNYNDTSPVTLDYIERVFRVDKKRLAAIPAHTILCRDPVWHRQYSRDLMRTEQIIRLAVQPLLPSWNGKRNVSEKAGRMMQ